MAEFEGFLELPKYTLVEVAEGRYRVAVKNDRDDTWLCITPPAPYPAAQDALNQIAGFLQ